MGLDMYARAVKATLIQHMGEVDISLDDALGIERGNKIESMEKAAERYVRNDNLVAAAKLQGYYDPDLAYWRKFNALHGWMHRLYDEKGGESREFNCNTLRLMPEDINRLEREAATLTPTSGFFFGEQVDLTANDVEEVKAFCAKARAAFAAGMAVIYDSWW